MMIQSILTVCTGNICRSPLAERVLRRQLPAVRLGSAGIGALVGHGADEHAVAVAQENRLDLSEHRARQLDEALIGEAELVLVMDNSHSEWIDARLPHARGRVFLLSHWDDGADIPDPYGHSLDSFRHVHKRIEHYAAGWIQRLGNQ